jgi:hypothetical protein
MILHIELQEPNQTEHPHAMSGMHETETYKKSDDHHNLQEASPSQCM